MTESRKWFIRKSAFPWSALGEPLGTVVARNLETAYAVASCSCQRPFTIEPFPKHGIITAEPRAVQRHERRKPRYNRGLIRGVKTPKRLKESE